MKEIGSEFWMIDSKETETQLFLSGRTALEYIIRNIILEDKNIKSVLIPSWCCHTMIEPFVRHKISIRFYDVYYDEEYGLSIHLPEPLVNEIFYYMTYFGSSVLRGLDESFVRKNWCCVIADDTHAWLGKKRYEKFSLIPDYVYISYRKWSGLYGIALAQKNNSKFSLNIEKKSADQYVSLRKESSRIKNEYIEGKKIKKKDFLNLYGEAEEMLERDYVNYGPSISAVEQLLNLDCQKMKAKRSQNALLLINGLSDIKNIKLIKFDIEDNDVPLFVPILLDETERDLLKNFLINNGIFCPVHWPLSDFHKGISKRAEKIYHQELSILCDQRYGTEDINYIIEKIKEFFVRRAWE